MVVRGVDKNQFFHYRSMQLKKVQIKKKFVFTFFVCFLVFSSWLPLHSDYFRNQFKHFSIHNGLSQVSVLDIIQDKKGFIWFATLDGLNQYDGIRFIRYKHDSRNINTICYNRVNSIAEDQLGNLWIGTGNGLDKFDPVNYQFTHYRHQSQVFNSLSSDEIWYVTVDHLNHIWIATERGGVNEFDPKAEKFIFFRHDPHDSNSICSDNIRFVYPEEDVLWVATIAKGLDCIHRGFRQISHFHHNPKDPRTISGNTIGSILRDKRGILWTGTLNGLNWYDSEKNMFHHDFYDHGDPNSIADNWINTLYEDPDGLQSNEFNSAAFCKTQDGMMLFGVVNSITAFFPDEIRENSFIPPIVLTEFQLFNKTIWTRTKRNKQVILDKSITYLDEMTLSHKDNILVFQFAALNYIYAEKNQYAYMVESLEKDWNYVGKRNFASYTNLPPGHYTFRVKGSNNDGVWNEAGISLKLHITPPFFRTLWFQLPLAMIILVIIFIIHRWRTYTILLHNEMLEESMEERTAELKEVNQGLNKEIAVRKRVEREKEKLIKELKSALEKVITLHGMLPICSFWKKIRNDKGYWQQVEIYIRDHSNPKLTHGLCPDFANNKGKKKEGITRCY